MNAIFEAALELEQKGIATREELLPLLELKDDHATEPRLRALLARR